MQLSAQTLGGATSMASKAEEVAGRCLRSVLAALADGDQIEESEDSGELQLTLLDPTRLAAGAVSTMTPNTKLEIRADNKPTTRKET